MERAATLQRFTAKEDMFAPVPGEEGEDPEFVGRIGSWWYADG